tara:strand:- start:8472 stop:10208 length:1737 start_codon:yes stop_codon:yes gene_type:complete
MSNLDILKRLYKDYTKKFLGRIFLSVFFSVLVAGSTSSIAYLLDPAIEKIFIEKNKQLMILIPIAILFAFSLKGISLYLARTILIRMGGEIQKILQLQIMDSVVSSNLETMDKKHSGKIISHLQYDSGMVKNLVTNTILLFTKDTLTLIGLITVMFYQNWRLAIFALVMIPLASIAAKSLGKRVGKITTQAQEAAGIVHSFFLDVIKNHKIIKIFQREDYENERLNKNVNDIKEKMVKIEVVMTRSTPIMESLTGLMIALLIYFAGNLVMNENLDINNFFSFLAAMMLAYQPVRSLATLNMGIHQGLSAAKRILPIIDNKFIDKNRGKELNVSSGNIEFKEINFKYTTRENSILENVNLIAKSGEMTALVGHSGAGKSTIMNLIPKFYTPSKGKILIDNQDISHYSIFSLRKNISLVSQDISLFDDSIKNNIKYSNLNASDNEIIAASKMSSCDEFIMNMPNGYDTMIGENGVRLSGGEKQRLSIARAMLKDSKIILLDEATSSLDSETESKIQNAINFLTKGKTTLVIAHRLSTIINCNKIYVVENGKIIDEGNHKHLLSSSNTYKKFYEKQLREQK